MASVSNDDGSEDVADFLERIRELGDKRNKEDEEKSRKLEEEILQGRKEREARRAGMSLCVRNFLFWWRC
jgi:hypothetical protein